MDDPADMSSQDGSGRYLLDEGSPTRNRKVVGSNPTSGSKTPGQRVCTVLPPMVLLASLIIPCAGELSLGGPPRSSPADHGRHDSEVSADRGLVAAVRVLEPAFQGTLFPEHHHMGHHQHERQEQ
jgi:hypothetical protein